MAIFTWDDMYSVGIPEMDNHHKKLFDIINALHDHMKAGAGEDQINRTIKELISYTEYHFGEEEKLMERANYAGIAAQKRAHIAFVDKMKEFAKEAEAGKGIFVVSKVSKTANDWLKEHILVLDKQYEDSLKKAA